MEDIQLEFNIENLPHDECRVAQMQKQVDDICISMNKVRKKLFGELGEVKKQVAVLKKENEELRDKLKSFTNEKTEWIYDSEDRLFEIM